MSSIIWQVLGVIAICGWLAGVPFARGVERKRTFKPDPIVYYLWPLWLTVAVIGQLLHYAGRSFRHGWHALETLGENWAGRRVV